jgi:hypothetical protein
MSTLESIDNTKCSIERIGPKLTFLVYSWRCNAIWVDLRLIRVMSSRVNFYPVQISWSLGWPAGTPIQASLWRHHRHWLTHSARISRTQLSARATKHIKTSQLRQRAKINLSASCTYARTSCSPRLLSGRHPPHLSEQSRFTSFRVYMLPRILFMLGRPQCCSLSSCVCIHPWLAGVSARWKARSTNRNGSHSWLRRSISSVHASRSSRRHRSL